MRQLLREARKLGVQVISARIVEPDLLGYYVHDRRLIVLREGMTRAQTRSVLAHELGHAYYGHTCDNGPNERQANRHAAMLLIDPARYAKLECIDPDEHHLAEAFDVTVDVIFTFEQQCLTRLQDMTYTAPRIGIDQWAYRGAHA